LIFCTAYDRSRLGALHALLASVRRHHPDAYVLMLRVDDSAGPDVADAEILGLDDLPIERPWERVAATAIEYRDSVLAGPVLAAALQRDDRAVFLSTTMRVCAALTPLLDALDENDLALVTVAEQRLPDDDRRPSANVVEAAGLVNPRVIALRGSELADQLLAGWPTAVDPEPDKERPTELTYTGVARHLERFATAPSGTLLDDPGLAVAYWNLPLRPVTTSGEDELRVGGKPLRLLDLSGMDASDPVGLWSGQDRVHLTDMPALARLVVDFADELRATPPDAPSPYVNDSRGRPFDEVHRQLVREAIAEGALAAAPWTQDGAAEWEAFLSQPATGGAAAGVTRQHYAIWKSREDLQEAFPDLDGPDGSEFVRLVAESAPPASIPPQQPSNGEPTRSLPWGVNVAGFFRSELGLGEAARLLITSLDRANVPALPIHGAFVPPTRQNAEFTYTSPRESPYPINIVCLNGDLVPSFANEVDPSFFIDRHTIALWWWEVVGAFPPDWHAAFDHLDEIWVATDQIYEAIAPHSAVPVNKVRMPVVMPRIGPHPRSQLGMPEDGFTFLYIFDYHSTAARKNPVGHIEAFKAAFGEGSGANLVLKCINADRMAAQHTRTLLAIDEHPDITVIDRFVSADEKNAMIAACDCYLSLHRSEGFGLTPAEAMALGKPVIATRYGGILDFMTDQNSYLVDHGWTKVGPGAHPYPAEATWAEPDLEHAARLMREVFEDRAEARRRGERGRRDIREHHDPSVAGGIMRARLQNIHNGLARKPRTALVVATGWNRDVTAQRIAAPVGSPTGRGRALKGSFRRAISRAIKPFLVRQHGVDQHLFEGLVELENRFLEISQGSTEVAEERAQTLAAFRRVRAQIDDHERWLDAMEHDLRPAIRTIDHRVAEHLAEHRALPFMTEPFERWNDPDVGTVEGFRSAAPARGDDAYFVFEQRFRGSRDRILRLQRPYVELLRGRDPVLDCGCGRGELLELLRDASIAASGVDLDEGMLQEARRRGLDVAAGDAVQVLTEAADGAFGAVTAMQVIEHFPERTLSEFLRAARHSLRPGGRLVVETVNPHSVVALKAFWLDPTHQHPLFPEVVLELCREAGFDEGFAFYPGGRGDPTTDRYTSPAYAVVADVADSPTSGKPTGQA
jgi:2-polyprenyl-3-methyl-5-hydroxy-6-metoxy-1,4-benzoquinol methylase/glycosyltransferase involved in cell wall biosynthesis